MPDSPDDEFLELLKKSPFEEPSPFGEIMLHLKVAPASMQSRSTAIAALQVVVHEETAKYQYLLSGDVSLEITWHFHERDRYESDASADIDNLLKPMLDAFCGPNGLLIDDCQIRTLSISWISTTSDKPAVTIQLKFIDSDFVPKAGIAFVQIEKALCMPVITLQIIWRTLPVWTNWRGSRKRPGNWPLIAFSCCNPIWRISVP